MVSPEQEASADLLEEREKLVPLAPLDLLDSLDLLLVPFTLDTYSTLQLLLNPASSSHSTDFRLF